MICYCERCGRLVQRITKELNKPCDICGNNILPVPDEYTIGGGVAINSDLKDEFIEKYIKSSPNFDQSWFDRKDEIRAKQKQQWEKVKAFSKEQNRVPHCPTCQSTNIQKIGGLERVGSVAVFGLFSKKINKSFKCGNCGYTW